MKCLLPSFLIFFSVIHWVDCTVLEAAATAIFVYTFLSFISAIGKTIALLACICAIASLEILLVPAITYWFLPASMPIESTAYFSYALPAFIAFYVGINAFDKREPAQTHTSYFRAVTDYLQTKSMNSIVLLLIGLLGFTVKTLRPNAPNIISALPAYCLFISAFYAYFSKQGYRYIVIGLAVTGLLIHTVWSGMFGDLFFWLLLTTIFLAVDRPEQITIRLKTTIVLAALVFLLLIQSIKGEYRYNTWGNQRTERTGDIGLMADLLADRSTHPEKLLNVDHVFRSLVRFNQGIMIGSAMIKVPMHEAYANGEVLMSLLYPFVPRLVWANKPQTGGYENIRRFTSLPQSENTSINLSPLGEGYVNFGYGGILFSLAYGLLLGGIFQYVLQLAERIPSIILWLPMLYIGCLTMETDLLSTWGSLVNNAIFIGLLFWSLKRIGIDL